MIFDITRFIAEKGPVKSSEIKQFGRSALETAMEKKYIEKDDNFFNISKKGLDYLEPYRVKNAVILAAGYNSRFIPFTYDRPHGLLEVRGEPLVERQIKLLKSIGIEDITVVVGYMSEQFEYLQEEFLVDLKYNPNFLDDYDISSLELVSDRLFQTYVLTADLYISENVLHRYERTAWYGALHQQGLEDSFYPVLDDEDRFVDLEKRTRNHQWILKGPLFFNPAISKSFQATVLEEHQNFNTFFKSLLAKESFELMNFKAHDVFRLDTIESLRAFDRTYLSPGKHGSLDLIGHIFKVNQDSIYDIQPMDQGMTNDSFLFTVKNKRYVFRIPGRGTESLISRKQEAAVYQMIDPLDIADELVYIDPSLGFKISRFYEGVRTLNDRSLDEVKQAMAIVRELHERKLKIAHEFNLLKEIQAYISLCEEQSVNYYPDHELVLESVFQGMDSVESLKREKVLCHIDPVAENFLVLPDRTQRLIDWEYAGMADPLLDVAMFAIYSDYNEDEVDELLEIYLDRKASKEEFLIYYTFIASAGFLWTLWTLYKESLGDFYGDYGLKQFAYAKKYSKKIKKDF